ncbi:putative mitochondrial protein [Cucumis melo var. makuwa]|uniref:Mitochondrial protein n=1 Tax=Cucumis melo var. makuwa TaxID=1194695 RepID=A0A5A7U305_CUCMM|nr:putative mitochondrial protein [Cucumis melo var. makuwa]TYK27190.1 putative mitochondrial protein [Cucumis melo var. makuwa]
MPWSIKTPLFYLFSPNKALLFSASAPTLLNKMDVLSANIATFLTQYVPSFFLPHALRNFGVKQLLHPSILSIVFLPPFFRTSLHSKYYMHTMFSRLSFFHSSFASPQPFFTDTSVDLFPLFESTLDNELAQSAPTSTTLNQLSISDDSPKPTPDTSPRRSTWVREPLIHLQDYHYFSTIVFLVESTSYQEASSNPLWQKAMNDELQALKKMHTWDYVALPPGKRPIGCKWINKIKTHSDGTIERYKARLVAKGLLVVDAAKQWPLLQMDVKNDFFNGTLSEEVYMKPPPSTSPPPPPNKGIVLLLLYVDDMIITGNDPQAISDLQHYLGITDSNTASTSLHPNVHLTPYDGVPLEDVSLYWQLVGSLIYLTVTRPDIAYVAGDPTDRRSTKGYCFYLGDSLISWRSKKQSVVSRSSTESEYRALADATAKLLWLHWLLVDMGLPQQGPTLLHCDNHSAIKIAHNDVFHERIKHIENDCHFIHHHLLSNNLLLQPVSTTEQPAYIFTKNLPSTRFNQLLTKLKLTATLPP